MYHRQLLGPERGVRDNVATNAERASVTGPPRWCTSVSYQRATEKSTGGCTRWRRADKMYGTAPRASQGRGRRAPPRGSPGPAGKPLIGQVTVPKCSRRTYIVLSNPRCGHCPSLRRARKRSRGRLRSTLAALLGHVQVGTHRPRSLKSTLGRHWDFFQTSYLAVSLEVQS